MDEFVPYPRYLDGLRKAILARNLTPQERQIINGILESAKGQEVVHTYVDDDGVYWDCTRDKTAAAPKDGSGGDAPSPPPFAQMAGAPARQARPARGPAPEAAPDRFGNVMSCPPGTVAHQRPALDRIVGAGTIRNYYSKGPGGGALPPQGQASEGDEDGSA